MTRYYTTYKYRHVLYCSTTKWDTHILFSTLHIILKPFWLLICLLSSSWRLELHSVIEWWAHLCLMLIVESIYSLNLVCRDSVEKASCWFQSWNTQHRTQRVWLQPVTYFLKLWELLRGNREYSTSKIENIRQHYFLHTTLKAGSDHCLFFIRHRYLTN